MLKFNVPLVVRFEEVGGSCLCGTDFALENGGVCFGGPGDLDLFLLRRNTFEYFIEWCQNTGCVSDATPVIAP